MHQSESRFVVSCVLMVAWALASPGANPALSQTDESVPATWSALETAAFELVEQDKFDEALDLMDRVAPGLKDRAFEVSDLTLTILFSAGRTDEAMSVWEKGLEDGFFYFVVPRMEIYAGVRKSDRFRKSLARNNSLRAEAQKTSRPEFKVITPASYNPDATYPLLMIIHGGNQSIAKAMNRWKPEVVGDELIIAYVQASHRADTRSYRWDLGGVDIYSNPTAQDEVLGLYRTIVGEYPVDTEQVTLAGFSQGGNLALIMAAEGTIPARGFIAGCPAIRSPIMPEVARAAAARGLRGTLFVGAQDWTAAAAQTTVDNFKEAGMPVNHIVMEDKGHEFPDDFEDVFRGAVEQIHQ